MHQSRQKNRFFLVPEVGVVISSILLTPPCLSFPSRSIYLYLLTMEEAFLSFPFFSKASSTPRCSLEIPHKYHHLPAPKLSAFWKEGGRDQG